VSETGEGALRVRSLAEFLIVFGVKIRFSEQKRGISLKNSSKRLTKQIRSRKMSLLEVPYNLLLTVFCPKFSDHPWPAEPKGDDDAIDAEFEVKK